MCNFLYVDSNITDRKIQALKQFQSEMENVVNCFFFSTLPKIGCEITICCVL